MRPGRSAIDEVELQSTCCGSTTRKSVLMHQFSRRPRHGLAWPSRIRMQPTSPPIDQELREGAVVSIRLFRSRRASDLRPRLEQLLQPLLG
jgi:hypothetical protein